MDGPSPQSDTGDARNTGARADTGRGNNSNHDPTVGDAAKDTPDAGANGAGGPRPPRARSYVGWLIVGILAVIYLVPYAYTASPGACASCHSMKPFYESWKRSTHSVAASSCLDCHVRQSAFALATYRLMFYREIVAQAVGADLKPWGATVPGVDSCHRSGCHSLNRLTSTSGELRINHRTHVVKARISCTKCHPGAAHKGVGKRFLLPPRKLCRKCHAAKMKTDCSYCHVKRVAQLPAGGH